ncbi:MAG TPA: hypothetical protein VF679_09970 [Pedobacter sp.]|jgi:hypothetical protein
MSNPTPAPLDEKLRYEAIKPYMYHVKQWDADDIGDFQRELEAIYDAGYAAAAARIEVLESCLEEALAELITLQMFATEHDTKKQIAKFRASIDAKLKGDV